MRTRTTQTTQTRRPERRADHQALRRPAEEPRTGEARTREAGGPQDSALYSCGCGHAFSGDVSTHVACPKCGADQVW